MVHVDTRLALASAVTHPSLPRRGPVRTGGLIAAHHPVSRKLQLNAGHSRATFPAAPPPSLDCKSNSRGFPLWIGRTALETREGSLETFVIRKAGESPLLRPQHVMAPLSIVHLQPPLPPSWPPTAAEPPLHFSQPIGSSPPCKSGCLTPVKVTEVPAVCSLLHTV